VKLLPNNREHGWAPYVWLVFLSFFYFQPLLGHAGLKEWLITISSTLLFLAMYFGIFWVKPPFTYVLLGCMVAMGMVLAPLNPGASVFIIFASSFIPWILQTPGRAFAALAGLILLLGLDALLFHAPVGFWAVSMVVALGVCGSNIHFAEKNRADHKLRMAQGEVEHLAKVAERERIARDLHDVLGHTLSVIVLKSELAGRLMERDPERAAHEIAEVEKTARMALKEVREAIGGYRSQGLAAEVEMARNTLQTAGVALACESALPKLTAAEETVLCLALREAVTNIVRHAHATQCRMRFATTEDRFHLLRVEDDGPYPIKQEGNGLRGMRERVQSLGGRFSINSDHGTTLTVELPVNPVSSNTSMVQ
jgi:two-component system, NarL family, sensor histidine kinase DesK